MWWGGRRKEGETVARQIEKRHNLAAFWALGLLNNIVYVIMLAGAKGEGGRKEKWERGTRQKRASARERDSGYGGESFKSLVLMYGCGPFAHAPASERLRTQRSAQAVWV